MTGCCHIIDIVYSVYSDVYRLRPTDVIGLINQAYSKTSRPRDLALSIACWIVIRCTYSCDYSGYWNTLLSVYYLIIGPFIGQI